MKDMYLSIENLSLSLANRTISIEEVAEIALGQINRHNAKLDAYIHVQNDGAIEDFKFPTQTDQARTGDLWGIPYALKDLIDFAGVPTTCNSRSMVDNIAVKHADVTQQLESCGALYLGKLNTNEFACGGIPTDALFPACKNPWDLSRTTGGSSSGSAVAVAADMAVFTLGSDTNGSIRIPASYCGTVGLKPTFGLLSTQGIFPLGPSADHVGPLCKSVWDAASILQALVLPESKHHYLKDIDAGVKGMRIGVDPRLFDTLPIRAHIAQDLQNAIQALKIAGADIVEVDFGALEQYNDVARGILSCEGWAIHHPRLKTQHHLYGTGCKERLMQGAFFTAEDYFQILQLQKFLTGKMREIFDRVDVVLTPSCFDDPQRLADPGTNDKRHLSHFHMPFNVSGQPAMVIPTQISSLTGMPMSLQLAANHEQEAKLFRVGRVLERHYQFAKHRNPYSWN